MTGVSGCDRPCKDSEACTSCGDGCARKEREPRQQQTPAYCRICGNNPNAILNALKIGIEAARRDMRDG